VEETLAGSVALVRSLAADWWCWLGELPPLLDFTLKQRTEKQVVPTA